MKIAQSFYLKKTNTKKQCKRRLCEKSPFLYLYLRTKRFRGLRCYLMRLLFCRFDYYGYKWGALIFDIFLATWMVSSMNFLL